MHCQTQARSSTEQSAQAAQWRTAQHCSRLDKREQQKGNSLAWTTSSVAWVAVFALDTSTHTVTEPHCDHGHKQSNRDWFEKGSLPSKRQVEKALPSLTSVGAGPQPPLTTAGATAAFA